MKVTPRVHSSFGYWLQQLGLSDRKAAKALGIHYNTVAKYRREGCPRYIMLACKALYHRLGPEE